MVRHGMSFSLTLALLNAPQRLKSTLQLSLSHGDLKKNQTLTLPYHECIMMYHKTVEKLKHLFYQIIFVTGFICCLLQSSLLSLMSVGPCIL